MSDDNQQLPDPLGMPSVSQTFNATNHDGMITDDNTLASRPTLPIAFGQANTPTGVSMPQVSNSQVNNSNAIQSTGQSTQQSDPPQQALTTNNPTIADDVDLIEKVWVEKAKEIVDKTRDNPYLQNKAISEMKADYIKKRYNKDISKSD